MSRSFGLFDVMYLVMAVRWTIGLTLLAILGGTPISLIVAALGNANSSLARLISRIYTGTVQGIPGLAWIFIFFFGPSVLGFNVSPWVAATLALSVYAGAFMGEIWRGALASVPPLQWQSSLSLGMTYTQQLRYVIAPQAIKIAIPASVGFFVSLVKTTSLASTIGFVEVTRQAQIIAGSTLQPLPAYCLAAALYFAMCFPVTLLARRLERAYAVS